MFSITKLHFLGVIVYSFDMQVLLLLLIVALVQVSAFVAPFRAAQRISTQRNLFGSEPPKNSPAKTDDKGGGMFGGKTSFRFLCSVLWLALQENIQLQLGHVDIQALSRKCCVWLY